MNEETVSSEDTRRRFRELMDSVEHHGVHVTVMRYRKPAVVIVPREWYEQARGLMENRKQTRVLPRGGVQAGDRIRLRASGEIPSSHATITEGPA